MSEANAVKYVLNDSQIAEVIYRKAKSGSGEAETNVSQVSEGRSWTECLSRI